MFKNFLHLVRVIFPNWNFFDKTGYTFKLYFRTHQVQIQNLDWEPMDFTCRLTPFSLFFNPEVNYRLTQISVLEHFAHEVQKSMDSKIQNSTLYNIMCSMVLACLQDHEVSFHKAQFKIEAVSNDESTVIYTSDWILNQ